MPLGSPDERVLVELLCVLSCATNGFGASIEFGADYYKL